MSSTTNPPDIERIYLEPDAQAFLDELAKKDGPPINELPVEEARKVLAGAQAGPAEKLPVDIQELSIPGKNGGRIKLRVVRPENLTMPLPAVMYFHGGGWALGDVATHDRLVRQLAHGAQAAVVFVDYGRSPETQYPETIHEAYAATKWVSENGLLLNVDATRIAVAGDSAGGNLATVVTLLAKEQQGPKILQQVLFYPVTDANFDTPSYDQFAEGYFLTRDAMKWFWDLYIPDVAQRKEPTASPLQATKEQLANLPPALVITGEADVLRDEGEAYAQKLESAGVSVKAIRYPAILHDFVMLNALSKTEAAQDAIAEAGSTLKSALHWKQGLE